MCDRCKQEGPVRLVVLVGMFVEDERYLCPSCLEECEWIPVMEWPDF